MQRNIFDTGTESRVQKAREYALRVHGQQQYGDKPYVFHLDQVVALLRKYGEDAQVIGYLHDTVEDTEATLAEVRREFGALVAECVDLVSDAPGPDRKSRKAKTYARLAKVSGPSELALVVKAADRLANVRMCIKENNCDLLRVYQQEQPTFYRSAYRAGLCDEFWTELHRLLQTN
jgi:guanosine-3',5'-bis(diphosphate) 3'-pyrophosphohydrolase